MSAEPTLQDVTMRSTKAEIFAAYERASAIKPHRPMEPMVLAQLIICETAVDIARWVMDRKGSKACFGGDDHARDTMKAMQLFEAAQKLLAPRGSSS